MDVPWQVKSGVALAAPDHELASYQRFDEHTWLVVLIGPDGESEYYEVTHDGEKTWSVQRVFLP